MRKRIIKYKKITDTHEDFRIGCRILAQPVFLPEEAWLPVPSSWSRQIVVGKQFTTDDREGMALWEGFQEHLVNANVSGLGERPQARYGEPTLIQPRLGQGAFRVAVTDAYERKCAVTGGRTLPVLDAAHIKPYAIGGEHEVRNGLLLRTDIHTLFDIGYVTISTDGKFEVSNRIKDDYENGREYYGMAGRKIFSPKNEMLQPSKDFIEWHNNNRYLG